jgi:UDP:flavonoid glycosyltransferase YjiC (YdhE family)
MRVLFTVSNWSSHYYPMIPLGWALQAEGHEVRVACHESEVEPVTRAGLTPVVLMEGWSLVFQARLQNVLNARDGLWPYPAPPLHPVTGAEMATHEDFDIAAFMAAEKTPSIAAATRSTDGVVEFARQWRPDLVIHDLLSLEGLLAAKLTGVPALAHLWGPVGTEEDEPGLDLRPVDYSGAFTRYGLPPMSFRQIDHIIDPCPASLQPAVKAPRLPVRYVPYNGPWAMAEWLLDPPERPRVCVAWGNSATQIFGRTACAVPSIVEALAVLDVEVILTCHGRDVDALGRLPSNVRHAGYAPLSLVLPTCDAVVHYGGGGCAMTAVAAGVPQMIIPTGFDQYAIGRRIAATGAGIEIPNHTAGVEAIRSAVGSLVSEPAYRAAAASLHRETQEQPSPAGLVPALEDIAWSARRSRPRVARPSVPATPDGVHACAPGA